MWHICKIFRNFDTTQIIHINLFSIEITRINFAVLQYEQIRNKENNKILDCAEIQIIFIEFTYKFKIMQQINTFMLYPRFINNN